MQRPVRVQGPCRGQLGCRVLLRVRDPCYWRGCSCWPMHAPLVPEHVPGPGAGIGNLLRAHRFAGSRVRAGSWGRWGMLATGGDWTCSQTEPNEPHPTRDTCVCLGLDVRPTLLDHCSLMSLVIINLFFVDSRKSSHLNSRLDVLSTIFTPQLWLVAVSSFIQALA